MPTIADLADRYWKIYLEAKPTYASLIGEHKYDSQIEDLSDEGRGHHRSRLLQLLAEVEACDPGGDPTTRDLLAYTISADLVEEETEVLVAPVDPNIGIHSENLRVTGQTRALEPWHAEALAERFAQVPRLLEQAMVRHRRQAADGLTPAAASVRRVVHQLDKYLASELSTDPYAGLALPEGWDGAERWRSAMEELVVDRLRPAFAAYRNGLETDILPRARDDAHPGICHLPDGEAIYQRLVERFVTLPSDPADIHRIGDQHASQTLVAEYAEVGEEALGESDLGGLFDRLRTDPSLRYESAEEMLDLAREAVERGWAAIDGWLGARPDRPCDVQPVPEALAKDMPPAFYMQPSPDGTRPGIYFLNTHQAETRDRFSGEATAFHEAIPGHHFDRALATALTDLPAFRRHRSVNVHAEGWGLYSERLADEMGLYSSPLDRIGMLAADSWRAARLVVDTGMHFHGWSRDRAMQYMVDWTPISRGTIEQEIDRYIGWPGQALSYKMGQIEIDRLRREAEQALGDRFDIVGFHDTVLTSGSVTLPVLRRLVSDWVDRRG